MRGFELSFANGFTDSSAASKSIFLRLCGVCVFFSFSVRETFLSSCTYGLFLPMQRPRCGHSCHCSSDRYPSSQLRAKVTTLYLESQLMPPPLSRDHPLIIDEPALRPRSYAALAEFIAGSRHSPPLRECLRKKHALLENGNRRSR